MYACIYRPPAPDDERRGEAGRERSDAGDSALSAVASIARDFSPRYELHSGRVASIDVAGLDRLLGPAPAIGDELRRAAASRRLRAHVAVAHTRTAAMLLAIARPGLTVVPRGAEAAALAPLAIDVLGTCEVRSLKSADFDDPAASTHPLLQTLHRWGLRTLGDLAALPAADVNARLGKAAAGWQAIARGEDLRPLIPALADERFESSIDLEWPIEALEPLSFVLTRLLEPLSTRLERRDRGAAVLHVLLRLVTREVYARRLELPTPMRDVRTLRMLALLDLETNPPPAGIDRVTVVIDPTPGRIVQHTLFTRAQPTPEQLSALVARLGALIGPDRFGAPAAVDSHRPGAFAMAPFAVDRKPEVGSGQSARDDPAGPPIQTSDFPRQTVDGIAQALRRCRQPVPARVGLSDGRPSRVTTDRRGFAGGTVTRCSGPWRTSGEWWVPHRTLEVRSEKLEVKGQKVSLLTSGAAGAGAWDRDEWDVALSDGAVYRIFRDRALDAWFVDGIVD